MDQANKDKLVENLKLAPQMFVVRYGAVVIALWGAWKALDESTQASIIAALPIPPAWIPPLTVLVGFVMRVWPQVQLALDAAEKAEEKAKDEAAAAAARSIIADGNAAKAGVDVATAQKLNDAKGPEQ